MIAPEEHNVLRVFLFLGMIENKPPSQLILFQETQTLRQPWLWFLVVLAHLGLVTAVWKTQKAEDLWFIGISWIIWSGMTLLLHQLRLTVKVDEEGILVQFSPFHRKPIRFYWHQIEVAWVGRYSPLWEFGGWGWRYNFSGNAMAWSLSGSQGVKLLFGDGKKRLIGTKDVLGWSKVLQASGKWPATHQPPF